MTKYDPLKKAFSNMHYRCKGSRVDYGDRYQSGGIGVCPEWFDYETFKADMGPRPPRTLLDRIDNTKGYSKDNCRWADPSLSRLNQGARRPYSHLTQAERDKIVELRVRHGWKVIDIARVMGRQTTTVSRAMRGSIGEPSARRRVIS